jgi:serpin B
MSHSTIASLLVGTLLLIGWGCAASPPTAPQADKQQVVEGNNHFALDLYARLRDRPGNLFFSPYSVSTALALTSAGARGETAEQMARTLHLTLPGERLHSAFAAVNAALTGGKPTGYKLYTANALWAQKGFDFLPEFVQLAKDFYGARATDVDFQGASEEARQTINAWVEQQTNDKIRELLKPGVINSLTRLVLTNAIYFKGTWSHPFDARRTREEDFQVTDERKVRVPLMQQRVHAGFLEDGAVQLLELHYAGDNLSFVAVLPRKPDGLPALEQALSVDRLATWLGKVHQAEVQVTLPRFKLTEEFDLTRTLPEMGMSAAFDGSRADFSGLDGKKDLYISAVVHKAFVDVNEEGTEAAAATGVAIARAAVLRTPTFRADHPFLFLIRDMRSGSILFLGRLADPGK